MDAPSDTTNSANESPKQFLMRNRNSGFVQFVLSVVFEPVSLHFLVSVLFN